MAKNQFKTQPKAQAKTQPKTQAKMQTKAQAKTQPMAVLPQDSPFWQRYKFFILAAILAGTALLYIPSSLDNGFTRYWDDERIVVQNEDIRGWSWEHLKNMFTQSYYDMYCPVKIISHTIDYQLFELNPAGYHLMSLFYHLVNIVLVFVLIYAMLKSSPAALAAAIIYALHPTVVETVSWVTGRGDLLYALFAFPALLCYIKYITKKEKKKYLLFTFLFFILSGLSKPTAMTLPVTLFVFDWYYKRKIFSRKVLIEKIPFFAISLILGILSIKLRSYGAPEISGFLEFFKSYRGYLFITYPTAFYIIKFIFPLPLSFIYPHVSYYFYNNLMLPVLVWSSPFILLAVLIIIWKAKNMRRPLIFTGLFYFSTIFSTLQIIPVVSISAHDRYFYVPVFGFVFFVAWLYVYFKQKNRSKAIMFYFTAILAFSLSFAVISFNRTKIWKSTITLFEDVIKKQPRFIEGYDKLAEHYEIIQDHRNAITWSKQVIKKRDNHPGTYVRLLKMHMALNELDSAMMYAPYAVNNATTEQQLVEVYSIKGYLDMIYKRYTDAIADYDIILRYDPNSAHSFAQRATAKMSLRQYEPALSDFARYLQLQPGDAEAYVNMARIYIDTNRSTLAIESLNNALQLNPEHPDAYLMRGYTLLQTGQRAAACADFNRAKDLGNTTALEWIQNYCR